MEDPERFRPIRGSLSERLSSFSFPCKKTEAKVNARVPLDPARRRVGRSTRKLAPPPLWLRRDSDSPRALFRPPRRCSARDKGKLKNKSSKNQIQAPFQGATGSLPLCGRSLTGRPETASFGPGRRSHPFGILDVASYACGSTIAAALARTKIYPFWMDTI